MSSETIKGTECALFEPYSARQSRTLRRVPSVVAAIRSRHTQSSKLQHTMLKQIEISGQRFELYSLDNGRTWSSSPQSIVAYDQRQTMLRLELRQRFEHIDEIQEPDPNNFAEFVVPMRFI